MTYTVSDTNWNRYIVTIPADTTGTIANSVATGLSVHFYIIAGSSISSGGSLNSWGTYNSGYLAQGHTANIVSTDHNWYMTGVQLEVGPVATPFEHRSAGDELKRCQRYYQQYVNPCCTGVIPDNGSKAYSIGLQFQTRMRAEPTLTITNAGSGQNISDGQSSVNISSLNAVSSFITKH